MALITRERVEELKVYGWKQHRIVCEHLIQEDDWDFGEFVDTIETLWNVADLANRCQPVHIAHMTDSDYKNCVACKLDKALAALEGGE